jgi:hypothetical protein
MTSQHWPPDGLMQLHVVGVRPLTLRMPNHLHTPPNESSCRWGSPWDSCFRQYPGRNPAPGRAASRASAGWGRCQAAGRKPCRSSAALLSAAPGGRWSWTRLRKCNSTREGDQRPPDTPAHTATATAMHYAVAGSQFRYRGAPLSGRDWVHASTLAHDSHSAGWQQDGGRAVTAEGDAAACKGGAEGRYGRHIGNVPTLGARNVSTAGVARLPSLGLSSFVHMSTSTSAALH